MVITMNVMIYFEILLLFVLAWCGEKTAADDEATLNMTIPDVVTMVTDVVTMETRGNRTEETLALHVLSRLGYLPRMHRSDMGQADIADALISNQVYKDAIREFQEFVNINVTGELDENTVTFLKTPRCGVKDKVAWGQRKTEMTSSASVVTEPEVDDEGPEMFLRRRKRYVLSGQKWHKRDLTFRVLNFTPDVSVADQTTAVTRAFETWEDIANLRFSRVSFTSGADIDIMFATGHHGDAFPFDGPRGSLAHAFFPPHGDVHLDEDETFSLGRYRGKDLYQILVHELGHSLGLRHSSDPTSVMWPYMAEYDPDWGPSPDDRRGIARLYGEKGRGRDLPWSSSRDRSTTTTSPRTRTHSRPVSPSLASTTGFSPPLDNDRLPAPPPHGVFPPRRSHSETFSPDIPDNRRPGPARTTTPARTVPTRTVPYWARPVTTIMTLPYWARTPTPRHPVQTKKDAFSGNKDPHTQYPIETSRYPTQAKATHMYPTISGRQPTAPTGARQSRSTPTTRKQESGALSTWRLLSRATQSHITPPLTPSPSSSTSRERFPQHSTTLAARYPITKSTTTKSRYPIYPTNIGLGRTSAPQPGKAVMKGESSREGAMGGESTREEGGFQADESQALITKMLETPRKKDITTDATMPADKSADGIQKKRGWWGLG